MKTDTEVGQFVQSLKFKDKKEIFLLQISKNSEVGDVIARLLFEREHHSIYINDIRRMEEKFRLLKE